MRIIFGSSEFVNAIFIELSALFFNMRTIGGCFCERGITGLDGTCSFLLGVVGHTHSRPIAWIPNSPEILAGGGGGNSCTSFLSCIALVHLLQDRGKGIWYPTKLTLLTRYLDKQKLICPNLHEFCSIGLFSLLFWGVGGGKCPLPPPPLLSHIHQWFQSWYCQIRRVWTYQAIYQGPVS